MPDYKHLPQKPGVYIYKDKLGKIIYVGKAINLKKRVSQYFQSRSALGPKTKALVSQISKIDFKIVGSEVEALVLEANLIKFHHPKYNSQLQDDKNYIYICISKEKYPRVFSSFKSKLDAKNYDIYGPFPDSTSVRFLLKLIRQVFPYRTFIKNHPKNCLYCHMHQCPGSSPNLLEYKKTIQSIKKILNGQPKKLIDQLQVDMYKYSSNQDYEQALLRKKQIEALYYINTSWKNLSNLTSKIDLPSETYLKAVHELQQIFLLHKISRIEAYDISNSNGFYVGSMVVYQQNCIDHSAYRQFLIKTKHTPDDQYMMAEVIKRRLVHKEWSYPDILLVDGGKPQVSSVLPFLKNTNITLIGLAKKEEIIITHLDDKFVEIKLPKYSQALLLLQSLRDEAHRFANRYRKKLISNSFSKN